MLRSTDGAGEHHSTVSHRNHGIARTRGVLDATVARGVSIRRRPKLVDYAGIDRDDPTPRRVRTRPNAPALADTGTDPTARTARTLSSAAAT
ncbi:MAG: hypothetical protein R2710_04790 [Acidimicrobiales bacterium]